MVKLYAGSYNEACGVAHTYDMCVRIAKPLPFNRYRYAIPTEESVCGRPTNTHLVLNRVVRCLGYVRNVGRLGCLHLCLVVGWFVADTYITDTRYLMYNTFKAYIPYLRYVHGMLSGVLHAGCLAS